MPLLPRGIAERRIEGERAHGRRLALLATD